MIEIKKVRGEQKVAPIKVTYPQMLALTHLAKKRGKMVEELLEALILATAKKRKWKWYLERKNGDV